MQSKCHYPTSRRRRSEIIISAAGLGNLCDDSAAAAALSGAAAAVGVPDCMRDDLIDSRPDEHLHWAAANNIANDCEQLTRCFQLRFD